MERGSSNLNNYPQFVFSVAYAEYDGIKFAFYGKHSLKESLWP